MVEIKGTTLVIGKKVFLRIHGEEIFEKVVGLLNEQEQAVFRGPIWAVQWYPLDYYIHWAEAIIKEIYKGDEEANLKHLVYPSVEEQFNLVYRAFLLFSSPESILERQVSITGTYFRGVTVEVEMIGSGRALLTYTGFKKQDRVIEISIRGWWEKVLEAARAKNYSFQIQTSIGEGKGYSEYIVAWESR